MLFENSSLRFYSEQHTHYAGHARSCFFSCDLFPAQDRSCGRRISPSPCCQHPSRHPHSPGIPLSASSQHSCSSCPLCAFSIPSSFSCSALFPRDAQRDDGKRAIKSLFFEQGKGRETG